MLIDPSQTRLEQQRQVNLQADNIWQSSPRLWWKLFFLRPFYFDLFPLFHHQCNNDSTTVMRGHPVATMDSRTTLDRVRALFNKDTEQNYEPLSAASTLDDDVLRPVLFAADPENDDAEQTKVDEGEPFSWFEYSIFLLLGIAMLWAWFVPSPSINYIESNTGIGICS
jgi:hypothetical protein